MVQHPLAKRAANVVKELASSFLEFSVFSFCYDLCSGFVIGIATKPFFIVLKKRYGSASKTQTR